MNKPDILTITKESELRQWYWKKTDLALFARHIKVSASGSKFEILDRICDKLEGRKISNNKISPSSSFDWSKDIINTQTTITDSYKSTNNVRRFMKSQIPDFKFNIAFMEWVRANNGKKMIDAVNYYLELTKNPGKTKIKAHNQFNKYLRDFFESNPDKTIHDARLCWAYKTKQPSVTGRHVYDLEDLRALQPK